jgi:putative Mg2+ transporter-C (MgtC) family protein
MHFDFSVFTHSFIALVTAFLLGSAIGYERQVRQRTAGLRTNALVAVGAAAFVDLAVRWAAMMVPPMWWPMWYPASVFWVPAPS